MFSNLSGVGKGVHAFICVILGMIANALGGFDTALRLLIVMIVADYITGLMVAIINKRLNSKVGAMGIMKKVLLLLIVWVAYEIDKGLDIQLLRNIVIFFYISNEGLSLLENTSKLGVPYPKQLKNILAQLKEGDGKGKR